MDRLYEPRAYEDNMRTLLLAGMVLAFAMSATAAQDVLVLKATKSTVTGVISNITDKTVTIATSIGVLTYHWEALDEKTIKRYNPDMYQQILDGRRKALEDLKRKQGLEDYKGRWLTPKQKKEAEMKDKGYALYEGKWMPTNEIETVTFKKQMEASGRKEYKGKWYTASEFEEVTALDKNKGVKTGMSEADVKAAWGDPAAKMKSPDFQARKRECWFYPNKEKKTEDRVVFEMGVVKEVIVDQDITVTQDE